MVIEVSATLVATMIFRASRLKTRCCCAVGQAGKEGKDRNPFPETSGKKVAGFPDVLFRRHEDQDVASLTPFHKIFNRPDRRLDMGDFPLFFQFGIEGLIADLDGIEPPGDLDDRGVVEGPGEFLRIDGGRGDDRPADLAVARGGFSGYRG